MDLTFIYTGIRTRDLDRSLEFYTQVMGMTILDRIKAPEHKGEFAVLKSEGSPHSLEINWYDEDSPVAGPYQTGEELDHLAFHTEDLDATLAYLDGKGYPMVMGPIESEHARWAYIQDPDGIYVEIFQYKAE